MLLENRYEIHSPGFVWNILRKFFSDDLVRAVKGMKLMKNHMGCVFDIPCKEKEIFLEIAKNLENSGLKI